jgi:hypothetical protein
MKVLFLSAAAMLGVSIASIPLAMSGPKQSPTVALGPTDTYLHSRALARLPQERGFRLSGSFRLRRCFSPRHSPVSNTPSLNRT